MPLVRPSVSCSKFSILGYTPPTRRPGGERHIDHPTCWMRCLTSWGILPIVRRSWFNCSGHLTKVQLPLPCDLHTTIMSLAGLVDLIWLYIFRKKLKKINNNDLIVDWSEIKFGTWKVLAWSEYHALWQNY